MGWSLRRSQRKEEQEEKKKKNKTGDSSEDVATPSAEDSPSGGDFLFDESVLSNLKMQYEKVAAETDTAEASTLFDSPNVTTGCNWSSLKKRKRAKMPVEKKRKSECADIGSTGPIDNVVVPSEMSVGSSVKKVRFVMMNNLVWKPQTPLPPQDVRIPSSFTPRGSALKKDTPTLIKKSKQRARKQRQSGRLREVFPLL